MGLLVPRDEAARLVRGGKRVAVGRPTPTNAQSGSALALFTHQRWVKLTDNAPLPVKHLRLHGA